MRLTRFYNFTYREDPGDAVVASHRLMVRGGFIKKLSAGIYNYMPMGLRVIRKIEEIVREEMNRAGAVELQMPAVQPSELWTESGRWSYYGPELLRFKDRKGADFCFGPTHEEVITDIVRQDVRSYRQLPINLYQIQTKFRDEARPRFGLMRGREFIMKDAYSFHIDEADAKREYSVMYDTYTRIFRRCGLKFKAVLAATGAIGGSMSHEFQVLAESGEDAILSCNSCEYAANVEKAACKCGGGGVTGNGVIQKVSTPGKHTVTEVTEFLKVSPQALVKTLIYLVDGKPVAVLVRGDHEISEAKLGALLKCDNLSLADDETVMKVTGAPVGFAGPRGIKVDIIADESVMAMTDFVTGANEADAHLLNTNHGRDFSVAMSGDIRTAMSGDGCSRCDGVYELHRGIEVGQVFYLGTKYSEKMKASYLDEQGAEHPVVMGCYGIGISRTSAAAIEQNHDANGIIWPMPIAPFQVSLLCLGADQPAVKEASEKIYKDLTAAGVEVLFDDRNDRPGVMFKDADLMGIPVRVSVGKKSLEKGGAEIKMRNGGTVDVVPLGDVAARIKGIINSEMRKCDPDEGNVK